MTTKIVRYLDNLLYYDEILVWIGVDEEGRFIIGEKLADDVGYDYFCTYIASNKMASVVKNKPPILDVIKDLFKNPEVKEWFTLIVSEENSAGPLADLELKSIALEDIPKDWFL